MTSLEPNDVAFGELLLTLYVDASFSTGGGRSRTGIAMYLVNPIDGSESLVQWASRRQTSMATSAPDAEVSAMAEGFAASIFLFDSLKELKLVKGIGPSCILSMKTDSAVALKQLNTQSVTVRSRTAAQKLTYLRELVYQAPQVEPIYISGQSQRADGQTKILSGQLLREAQRHFNLIPHAELRIQVCYHPFLSPKLVSIQEDRESSYLPDDECVETQKGKGTGGGGSRQLGNERLQMTPQERKQYEWYMRKYQNADTTRDPERERERISMIIAALFPHCSHMPPERTERKQGRKKGLQGETPGESRDEAKARTAAQKIEQQEQRAKAQQRALKHAAPSNVHHMSTRQKAQTKSGPSTKKRSPSPSQSSSSDSSSSSSTSSSPSKQKDDKQESKEVPEEQPNVPEPPQPEQQSAVETSMFYKLSKRLSKKTPASEALLPVIPFKDAQETMDMPPPDIPMLRQTELPPSNPVREHESGASSYASAEEPESQETHLSSSKRRRSWASLTPSASDDEMHSQSVDLQSHDPRPASVAMAGWGQGLGTATVVSSIPDEERPVLTKPLILSPEERIMEAGRLIESTLPVQYEENQAKDQDFVRPNAQLPAWRNREEFIKKLDGSRLLIVRAPTGPGKTTIYPALAARAIPRRFGRVCCTQVRRATTQGVCTGTKRMWQISPDKKVVGFQHGLEKSSQWDLNDTRVLFLTEGRIMRQAMKTPDMIMGSLRVVQS